MIVDWVRSLLYSGAVGGSGAVGDSGSFLLVLLFLKDMA